MAADTDALARLIDARALQLLEAGGRGQDERQMGVLRALWQDGARLATIGVAYRKAVAELVGPDIEGARGKATALVEAVIDAAQPEAAAPGSARGSD